jgi:hypothetical protein
MTILVAIYDISAAMRVKEARPKDDFLTVFEAHGLATLEHSSVLAERTATRFSLLTWLPTLSSLGRRSRLGR